MTLDMHKFGRALLIALALFNAHPIQAKPVTLGFEDMKKATFLLLRQGDPGKALNFANALLQDAPDDSTVLALKSRALRDLGRNREAVQIARLSWHNAKTQPESYGAAMSVAQALASSGNKFTAQFWLRRAAEHAPNPVARQIAVADFNYVRGRSKLALQFDASLQPSSNVNNGSSSAILNFLGLPFVLSGDAQALSGLEASVGMTARYTLAESSTAKTALRFAVTQKLVQLSADARAQAPTARNGDYAYGGIEVGLDHNRKLAAIGAEASAGLSFGKNWSGGDPLSNYVRLDLGLNKAFTPAWLGSVKLGVERQDRLDFVNRSASIGTLGFGLRHALGNGDQITLAVTGQNVQSASGNIDHQGLSASLDYARGKPVLGTKLSAGLSVETADYAVSPYSIKGREDLTLGASISMAFEKIDYMGFIPVMSIQASHTESNIELYQTNSLGIGLSIQSKF